MKGFLVFGLILVLLWVLLIEYRLSYYGMALFLKLWHRSLSQMSRKEFGEYMLRTESSSEGSKLQLIHWLSTNVRVEEIQINEVSEKNAQFFEIPPHICSQLKTN